MSREQVFTLEATPLKFDRGAASEAGWELERLGVKRAMLASENSTMRQKSSTFCRPVTWPRACTRFR